MKVLVEKRGVIYTVIINRPESRNAVDRETATQLVEAFEYREFTLRAGAGVSPETANLSPHVRESRRTNPPPSPAGGEPNAV